MIQKVSFILIDVFSIYSTDTVVHMNTLKNMFFLFLCLHNRSITWNVTQSLFCFTIYGSVSVAGKRKKREEMKKWSIFTYLCTLSHLLALSYDVVCHDNER